MEHRIGYGPAHALATLSLAAGESVMTEGGAMVSTSPGLEVQTRRSDALVHWLAPRLPSKGANS